MTAERRGQIDYFYKGASYEPLGERMTAVQPLMGIALLTYLLSVYFPL